MHQKVPLPKQCVRGGYKGTTTFRRPGGTRGVFSPAFHKPRKLGPSGLGTGYGKKLVPVLRANDTGFPETQSRPTALDEAQKEFVRRKHARWVSGKEVGGGRIHPKYGDSSRGTKAAALKARMHWAQLIGEWYNHMCRDHPTRLSPQNM